MTKHKLKINIKYPEKECPICHKKFKKQHNRQKYCSNECSQEARKQKRRIYNAKYYYKNRKRIHTKYLGTNTLAPKRNPDPERETQIVQNEIRRIGLQQF